MKATSVRLPEDLLEKLKDIANNNPRVNSRNDLIKKVLYEYVDKNK